eukprot:gene14515-19206_t
MDVWPFDLCPDLDPPTYLGRVGGIFATFDVRTQDSGNISFGVEAGGRRWFVKTAGPPSDTSPFLDHSGRVELLRNAARLAASRTMNTLDQTGQLGGRDGIVAHI